MVASISHRIAAAQICLARSLTKFGRSLYKLWNVKSTRTGLICLPFAVIVAAVLYSWSAQSNSFAMNAFLCLLVFDIVALVGDLMTRSYAYGGKPSVTFSFGYARLEVLTHFSILSLGLFLNLWSLKVFVTLAIFDKDDTEIHTGRFIPAVVLGSAVHFSLCMGNNMVNKLSKIFCTTTTLQRCAYRILNSFGLSIPSPSASLLTPFVTLGAFAAGTLTVLSFALQSGPQYYDFAGGVLIIAAIFDAIWPLFKHTGQILLQTIPPHVASQLEKVLRQSLTIDGVLEFRNELFWTVSYGHIAGTLQVRIRRDAYEQQILIKLHDKLQPIAPHLTIQVTKDDFSRNLGALHIICDAPQSSYLSRTNHLVELSPIPRPNGMTSTSRIIYSTSSDHLNVGMSNSFTAGANATVFKSDTKTSESSFEATAVFDSPGISSVAKSYSRGAATAHSRSASLDESRRNPFVLSSNSSPAGSQPNILISSANYFRED